MSSFEVYCRPKRQTILRDFFQYDCPVAPQLLGGKQTRPTMLLDRRQHDSPVALQLFGGEVA
eukprot:3022815-Heterocapsa_arctica.AAC.1